MKQVVIKMRGEFIEARKGEINELMKMIAVAGGIRINEAESEVVSEAAQWKAMVDSRTGWRGDVMMKCDTSEDIFKLFEKVEGKAFNVGTFGKITIEIIPHAKLVIEARNRATTV